MISAFVCSKNNEYVKWMCNEKEISFKSSTRIFGIPLRSGARVVVIDMHPSAGTDNAKIIECDGSELVRIKNPLSGQGAICFEDVFYVGNELTLIIALQGRQVACVIDEDGNVIRLYETR